MKVTPRLLAEQLFHDHQAAGRAPQLVNESALHFRDDEYLDHETWIRPAFAWLGDVIRQHVLDYGCGHGMASVVLARRGAIVTGVDLSAGYVEEARRRAAANEVQVEFRQADAEQLPFQEESFDAVWASAILHDLNVDKAARELSRVLKPGGVAIFCEPWGGNPLLEFARRYLPYPGKHRTPDERPLGATDIARLRDHFADVQIRGFQLLGMSRRMLRTKGKPGGILDRCDAAILRRWPWLEKWCRYVVVRATRA